MLYILQTKRNSFQHFFFVSNFSFFFSFFSGTRNLMFLNSFNKYKINIKISTQSSRDENQQPQNLLSNNTTLSKSQFYEQSQSQNHLPSRWYTVLALPFPDQKLARRDISTFGRYGFYQSRAGFFSEQPSPPLWLENASMTQHDNAIVCHSFNYQTYDKVM